MPAKHLADLCTSHSFKNRDIIHIYFIFLVLTKSSSVVVRPVLVSDGSLKDASVQMVSNETRLTEPLSLQQFAAAVSISLAYSGSLVSPIIQYV